MKTKLLLIVFAITLLAIPQSIFGQAPTMGSTANFVLFSSNGALANTGTSQISGDIGTNNGAVSTFNNVNGVIHIMDGATALCATDLTTLYNQLNLTTATLIAIPILGNGQIVTAGAYSISTASSLNGTLTLNGQGNSNAVFIFQLQGAFASNAGAVVNLTNGAQACNVFWKVEGSITLGAGTLMKGTLIANNALINIGAGTVLEGRAMSTTGAVSINGTTAYLPMGCGAATLTGPASPTLASTACFALFSPNGAVTNTGNTYATGDIGTNVGLTTGYAPGNVTGVIHPIPDGATGIAATELTTAYNYLNGLTHNIQLMSPSLFGNNLMLTPNVYLIVGATTLTDSLYLNAQGNPNAVFVIKVNGAFSSAANSKVVLLNGAQAKNVFWKIDGAVNLGANTIFKGTIVVNNAAISLNAGVNLNGRALTTTGILTTNAMTVTIPEPCGGASPTITGQPGSQTVCPGSSVSFVVAASGAGLTYQWRNGLVNLVNGGNISGATTATLTINPAGPADASANYNVLVNGTSLPGVVSIGASLVIATAPSITGISSSQTVCTGAAAIFSVSATGTGLSYQWRNGSVNLSNGGNISGATSAILNINPVSLTDASTNYNVVITGLCAPSVTSLGLSLAVNETPSITAQAVNQVVCEGSSATFAVSAIGTGITYQWRKGSVILTNTGNISGANSATLTINPTVSGDSGANYNVVITGVCSPTQTSANVNLTVNTSPTITSVSANQTLCAGTAGTFAVAAIGSGLTYQWRLGTVNLSNGGSVSGATSASLVISPLALINAGANYNVVVSGACAPSQTSGNISLAVNSSPTITVQAISQTVCAGSPVSFAVAASGTGLTYQWRKGSVILNNGGSILGATTATLLINPVTTGDAGTNYNLVITGLCGPTLTTANIVLGVSNAPTITAQAISQTVCAGTSVSFSVVTSGTGLTYQWRNGAVNISNGGNIAGATSAILTINPANTADAGSNYNVVVSGVCAPSLTSTNVSLTINTAPAITTQAPSQTVCAGGTVSFPVATSGSGLVYQWRKGSVILSNSGSISGATTGTLTINPVLTGDAGSNYNLVITGVCSPTSTSTNISLVVNTSPTITAQAISQTVCAGSPVNFSVTAVGTALTYQWRNGSVNLSNGGNISGATSSVLTINPANSANSSAAYNVVITGACSPTETSVNVSLVVNALPIIITQTGSQTVCAGNSASFGVSATGTGLVYQWKNGANNLSNAGNVSGANTATLTINPVTIGDAGNNYYVVITGACSPSVSSSPVSLLVNTAPVITAQAVSQTVCVGKPVSFAVTATGTGLTYQWRRGTVNLVNSGIISGATSSVLTISPVGVTHAANDYNVVIAGTCAPSVTSANVTLGVDTPPVIIAAATNMTACIGSPVSFVVNATGSGLTYQWRRGTVNLVNGGTMSGVTTSVLTISSVVASDAASDYNVVVLGTCSTNMTSNMVSLTVNTAPVIKRQPNNRMAYLGGTATFSVLATGTGLTYQWQKGNVNLVNGGNISGATSSVLVISPVMAADTGSNYHVIVSGTCSDLDSEFAILWICDCERTALKDNGAKLAAPIAVVYPNPFDNAINIQINDASAISTYQLKIYNVLGVEVISTTINKQLTSFVTDDLAAGTYFYKIVGNDEVIQSGSVILQR